MLFTIENIQQEAKKMIFAIFKNSYKFGEMDPEIDSFAIDIFGLGENLIIIPNTIEISEEDCAYHEDDDIFDLLGVYKFQKANSEGKIILYKNCIESFGKYFYEKNSYLKPFRTLSENDCINMIYKIVLWHELGHWITHWMVDSKGSRWDDRFWGLRPNPNDLLEGLAQLFTYFSILKNSDVERLKFLFEFMLLGQRAPYHKHNEIIESNNFSWVNSFKALELIRTDDRQDLQRYIEYL